MRNIAFSVVATVITSPVANARETLQAPRAHASRRIRATSCRNRTSPKVSTRASLNQPIGEPT